MILDMSSTLSAWSQSATLKTVVTTTVDFVETDTVTTSTIEAVIQPADKEKISPDTVDWSLNYIKVHSSSAIDIGQYVEWKNVDYKIIDRGGYVDYGYYRVIGEEVKGALLKPTAGNSFDENDVDFDNSDWAFDGNVPDPTTGDSLFDTTDVAFDEEDVAFES